MTTPIQMPATKKKPVAVKDDAMNLQKELINSNYMDLATAHSQGRKVAATFVDTQTGQALRLVPRPNVRGDARAYASQAANKWEAQLIGYQLMPAAELFDVQEVALRTPIAQIISRPGRKALCAACGEEIMNEREVVRDGTALCRACAGEGYYALPVAIDLPALEWASLPRTTTST